MLRRQFVGGMAMATLIPRMGQKGQLALVRICDTPTFHGDTHLAIPVTITTTGNDVQTDSAVVRTDSPDLNAAIIHWVKTQSDHVTEDDTVILIGGVWS